MVNEFTSVAAALEAAENRKKNGAWVPACGGTEVPFFTRNRRKLLYVWQATTGKHAYLDCETDLILSDEEAANALGM
jgi:hypothetical protein